MIGSANVTELKAGERRVSEDSRSGLASDSFAPGFREELASIERNAAAKGHRISGYTAGGSDLNPA